MLTQSTLGLGFWSMDQNVLEKNDLYLPISGVKNIKVAIQKNLTHARIKVVKNLKFLVHFGSTYLS